MNLPLAEPLKFLDLHRQEGCFIVPNAWDAGSAKMLASIGFAAIATTSAGIAFSLGRVDHGFAPAGARVDRATMLARVRDIAASVDVPVTADLEAGYGPTPADVAETITQAIVAGAAGGNIEDFTGDRARPLFALEQAVARIRAAREAIDRSGVPFVLNARTDAILVDAGGVEECIRRGNAYREAGADCIFVPGATDPEVIRALARGLDAPLNVVMGLKGNRLSLQALRDLGVRRVTIGGSLARAVFHLIAEAGREMLERGTFDFGERQIGHDALNTLFSPSARAPES
ncbi:MAG: isocitrate lyase/phosphoenolpyruvate mutase family protein [Polyangiales bacterium]